MPNPPPDESQTRVATSARPVDTARLVIAGLSLLQKVVSLVALTFLEWTRIRARRAEDEAAVAKSELAVAQKTTAIKEAADAKDPGDVIDDFLRINVPPS